jgi:DNA recombination-mediator protein A
MQRRPEDVPAARPRMEAPVLECDELAAWLRLTTTPKLGGAGLRRLLNAFGLPEQILRESEASLARYVGEAVAQSLCAPPSDEQCWLVDYTSIWLEDPGHYVVTLADAAYPASLLASTDPPAMLYVCGRIELLHPGPRGEPAVAIVGSRQASQAGRANAGLFARELGGAGVTVVSGLCPAWPTESMRPRTGARSTPQAGRWRLWVRERIASIRRAITRLPRQSPGRVRSCPNSRFARVRGRRIFLVATA